MENAHRFMHIAQCNNLIYNFSLLPLNLRKNFIKKKIKMPGEPHRFSERQKHNKENEAKQIKKCC